MNVRGWTWLEDTPGVDIEAKQETLRPILDDLARQWSELHNAQEQRGFARQAAIEDGDCEPDFESEEELVVFREMERARNRTMELRMEALETQMAENGARLMRPYEHWNEDERWMEWSERER